MPYNNSENLIELSNDLENNKLVLKPFYHTDLTKTLENILLKDKSGKKNSILERIFFDKSNTLKTTFKSLIQEIELRETLNLHLLRKINDEICRFHTHLMHIGNIKVQYFPDLFADVNKIQLQFEDNILELEQEKRKEYLECWRDLMFLKKYLLVAFKEYWDLVKKREMLEGDFEKSIIIKPNSNLNK